ncbi:MAG: PaaI family thioesterase [Pseudolabrys sp.]
MSAAPKSPAMPVDKQPAMTADEIAKLLASEFPQAFFQGCGLSIERIGFGDVSVRRAYREEHLRPGGTISGPTMMELADFAMYVAVFSAVGPQPLAVTTNLNINFLRKPAAADLIAEARLMKVGKRLAVGEVTIRSEGQDAPVAHVTSTYSIPQQK